MKTSPPCRRLALAALSLVTVTILGCPPRGGGGGKLTVERLLPPEGASAGGLAITVLGENFEDGPASVYFDGVPATDVDVVSDTEIRCVTPPGALGKVDIEVRSSGNVGKKEDGFQFLPIIESRESAGDSGGNDIFADYEQIPIEFPFHGFIGAPGDVDIFHFHPPADGKVFITLNWSTSAAAAGIGSMGVEFYQGPDPTSEPQAYFGGAITALNPDIEITDWMRPAFLYQQTHGPYLKVVGYGDDVHSGFDDENPYTLTIRYEPDATFEPAPQADNFFLAQPIAFTDSLAAFTVNSDYDDDFDWFQFTTAGEGWARVTVSVEGLGLITSAGELSVRARLFGVEPFDPTGTQIFSVPASTVVASDLPEQPGVAFEVKDLGGLQKYLLRLDSSTNDPNADPFAYDVTVEHGVGDLEAEEPGSLLPAETEFAANDLGTLSVGVPVTRTGYLFHLGDNDWFKFTAGATSNVVLEWDKTNVLTGSSGIGLFDPQDNPFGAEFTMLVFDELWFNSAGHLSSSGYAMAINTAQAAVQTLTIPAVNGNDYYLVLRGLRGWSSTESYTVEATQQ